MDVSKLNFRRLRPLRATAADRDRNAEVSLSPADFILPFFVVEGTGIDHPLPTLTGVSHLSIDRLVEEARKAQAAGITAGSKEPNKEKVGKVTRKQVLEIVKMKMQDLNATSEEAAVRVVAGTARSMGIEVVG